MKKLILPVLTVAAVFFAFTAHAGKTETSGDQGNPPAGDTASTANTSSEGDAAAQKSKEEAEKLASSEQGANKASQAPGPYDFIKGSKLEAAGPGERFCIDGKCDTYQNMSMDYCKATFSQCPMPAGVSLPKEMGDSKPNVK